MAGLSGPSLLPYLGWFVYRGSGDFITIQAIGALTVKGSVNVLPMESALASAVNSRPVSVAVDASSFQVRLSLPL